MATPSNPGPWDRDAAKDAQGDQHPEWDKTGEGALPRGVVFGCGIMLGGLMWAALIAWAGREMGWW